MNANEFYQLTLQQSDLLTSLMLKPYVMTLGVGIVKGKFSRCAWDVQSVPGSSTSFKASLGL
jgi:hypothetical protein